MKILDIPKECRPRERFLKQGPEALSERGGRGSLSASFVLGQMMIGSLSERGIGFIFLI